LNVSALVLPMRLYLPCHAAVSTVIARSGTAWCERSARFLCLHTKSPKLDFPYRPRASRSNSATL
jgi:hypothetical protein